MKKLFKFIIIVAVVSAVIGIGKKIIYRNGGDTDSDGYDGSYVFLNTTPAPTYAPVGYEYNTPVPEITEEPVVTYVPVITEEPVVTDVPVITEEPVVSDVPVATDAPSYPTQSTDGMFYYQLDEFERTIYDNCLDAALNGQTRCSIPDLSYSVYPNVVRRAYYALEQDHPEFIWLTTGYTFWRYLDDEAQMYRNCSIEFKVRDFWKYAMHPEAYTEAMMQQVKSVAELASSQPNDYAKAKFVYDYLITHTEYDYERLEDAQKITHNATSELIYTAYGCLVEGRCVCAGYAKAYKLIMNELGINCYYALGYAGEYHAWNMVEIDGEYYQVDPTWGDGGPAKDDGSEYENVINYEYFLLTTEELSIDHTLDEEYFTYPPADSMKYNYFAYNNYLLSSYDKQTMYSLISAQNASGCQPILIKFTNYSAYIAAYNDINTYEIGKLLGREVHAYCYDLKYLFYFYLD